MTKFAFVLLALAAPLCAEDLSILVTKVERKVEVSRADAGWEPATAGMKLVPGDRIHTGFKAVCAVKFPDGSALDVQPMSLVMLQKLDDGQGHLRSRVWLRLGEVSAQVNRSTGASADFNVKTPTTTASVRGTKINRISYQCGTGTIVEMGSHGLLEVGNFKGRVHLPPNTTTQVTDYRATPYTPERYILGTQTIQIQPEGTTRGEIDDIVDLGVPKTNPFTQGGTGLTSSIVNAENAQIAPPPPTATSFTRVTVNIPVLP